MKTNLVIMAALITLPWSQGCRRGNSDYAHNVDTVEEAQLLTRPITEWLDGVRATNQTYPTSLPPELIALLTDATPKGRYYIVSGTDGTECEITFGTFAENLYVLVWKSKTHEWLKDR